ncbi:hypothetical protein [Thomasclavelia cocleata]|jgi:predicted membrane protein|uniref:Uncharacterized protein n=1 Tax=Thomasclavelia cocleata TaxID=69824 RepID=A0A1I0H725_9FIRM|nr:hypothetical protein [Thomasclavelia cocleata]MCI9131273.1 hypothetical protein [Thomasclavelia cocleata]MCI9630360.1 hypothetical protein [Thomasclavelia cocleata]MCR1960009.1 hypothetical protein [Thomasclavelia cocleata]NDO41648.1 hypothetical protein [Thomasclavelia cocleata]PJN79689.1 hypothetical protein CWE04_10675 [Thomasclavelia cocleata]
MNKFQNAVYQFMLGRYGSDQFNVFLVILAIVLMILNLFFIRNSFLSAIVWLILIYSLYRIYSRNIYRRRAENDKYLSIIQPIQKRISMIKKNREDHEHKYFLCPECKQTVRVPRGHGKITITCPKCSHKFDKKS